jgi:5-methylcytosine-specific restriction endonuclease McrA
LARRNILRKDGWLEITINKLKEYCFVVDKNNKQLSPTHVNNAWHLIRKQKALLISKYPMVIQLKKEVKDENEDESGFVVGIDDGSKHVGIAIIQKCQTKNKVVFKGVVEQRQDVKHLMDVRRGYRKYHRQHKRYRKARFNNRSSSKRLGRLAPSIKQKKDAILRVLNRLSKWCNINKIILEDVQIDIRALQEGKKLYKWQYQKSNRLDENLRIATLMRDNYICQECGKKNCMLEAHHIIARRLCGNDSIYNLITLCDKCHDKTKGKEELYIEKYQEKINGKNIRFDYAQHVMQGKTYLRQELNDIALLNLTIGSETANKRIDWNIEKSHSNDAVVITGLKPDMCNIKEWIIKPMRRQIKAIIDEFEEFKHIDLIKYTKKNGDIHVGYIISLQPERKTLSFATLDGKVLRRYGIKSCKLLWRFNKIYWL